MSTATDGIVFWGVAFTDEHEDVNERISELVNGDPEDENSDLEGDGSEWLASQGLEGRVEFVHFCSESAPMWGIAAAGSVITARRGWVANLDDREEPVPPWWTDVHKAVLALAAEAANLGEYGWRLVSYWEI